MWTNIILPTTIPLFHLFRTWNSCFILQISSHGCCCWQWWRGLLCILSAYFFWLLVQHSSGGISDRDLLVPLPTVPVPIPTVIFIRNKKKKKSNSMQPKPNKNECLETTTKKKTNLGGCPAQGSKNTLNTGRWTFLISWRMLFQFVVKNRNLSKLDMLRIILDEMYHPWRESTKLFRGCRSQLVIPICLMKLARQKESSTS